MKSQPKRFLLLFVLVPLFSGCQDSGRVKVEAILEVGNPRLQSAVFAIPKDELTLFINNQCRLIESDYVLAAALSGSDIRQLDVILDKTDAKEWLRESLLVENTPGYSLMFISLSGTGKVEELEAVLDSVVSAYMTEVDAADRIIRAESERALGAALDNLKTDLAERIDQRDVTDSKSGRDGKVQGKRYVDNLEIKVREDLIMEMETSLVKQKMLEEAGVLAVKVGRHATLVASL